MTPTERVRKVTHHSLKQTREKIMKELNKTIHCKDGFTVSVQGHLGAYCTPREDYPSTPYTHVECGYPSLDPVTKELREYAESCDYTESIYAWVPIEVVQAELAAHGGIVSGKMPSWRRITSA